jgi:hypothetical protein
MKLHHLAAALSAATLAWGGAASAATVENYTVNFTALQSQPIVATAALAYDPVTQLLDVSITGTGFTPDIFHIAHIHGFADGSAPSRSPILANGFDPRDSSGFIPGDPTTNDGDGFTELAEGIPFYGGIMLSFNEPGQLGINADATGAINFSSVYDLSGNVDGDQRAAIFSNGLGLGDREIVIHGIETFFEREDQIAPGLGGGVNVASIVQPYYNIAIPAAVGEINATPVPLPAPALLLFAGLGGLAIMRRHKA